MRWQIEIESFEGDARLMIDLLRELSLNVDEVDGKYLLSGPALESLGSSSSVHDRVKNLNEIAAEVSKYDQRMELGFSFSVVIENLSSGVLRHHFCGY